MKHASQGCFFFRLSRTAVMLLPPGGGARGVSLPSPVAGNVQTGTDHSVWF